MRQYTSTREFLVLLLMSGAHYYTSLPNNTNWWFNPNNNVYPRAITRTHSSTRTLDMYDSMRIYDDQISEPVRGKDPFFDN
jgi:hypothetical protein